jgi:hypothetical protein
MLGSRPGARPATVVSELPADRLFWPAFRNMIGPPGHVEHHFTLPCDKLPIEPPKVDMFNQSKIAEQFLVAGADRAKQIKTCMGLAVFFGYGNLAHCWSQGGGIMVCSGDSVSGPRCLGV